MKQRARLRLRLLLAAGSALSAAAITAVLSLPTPMAYGESPASAQRVVQGKVFAASGSTQTGAVVYLKDMKSLEIKTYISAEEGAYRFGQLGTQDDYQLWAEYGGHKSRVKNISSFDSKKVFEVFLHIEDK